MGWVAVQARRHLRSSHSPHKALKPPHAAACGARAHEHTFLLRQAGRAAHGERERVQTGTGSCSARQSAKRGHGRRRPVHEAAASGLHAEKRRGGCGRSGCRRRRLVHWRHEH
jgi:hypothetical protein